jgi:hypothetical protein
VSTSYPRKSSSPGTVHSISMVLPGYALLAFSSIARGVVHRSRSASLNWPIEGVMDTTLDRASPRDGVHYREIAQKLRDLARQCHFPGARRELLNLAASFDRRADHFASRAKTPTREHPP